MMKNITKAGLLLILGLFVSISGIQAQQANKVEQVFKKSALIKVKKHATVNISEASDEAWRVHMKNYKVIREPGVDIAKDEYARFKKVANDKRAELGGNIPGTIGNFKTTAGEPTIATNFFGNFFDGIPNDNDIVVGRHGKVMSATNSLVFFYSTDGSGQIGSPKSLGSFYSSSNLIFDPKLKFDPDWNRFILVYLSGDNPTTSKVVVCFSETNDPTGNWNVYPLDGNPDPGLFGQVWTDFPQIGLTKDELIVTGNTFDGSQSVGGYVWQIDKEDGYNGAASLDVQGWGGTGASVFAISPAQDHFSLSDKIFMVNSRASFGGATSQIWLHEITDTVGAAGAAFNTYSLNASLSYSLAPDGDQKGTNIALDTRDCRIRTSFLQNNRIHFGLTSNVNGKPGLYIGEVKGIETPIFASVKSLFYAVDSFDVAYPAVMYGGCTDSDGDNSVVVGFNISGSNYFCGNAITHIDTNGIATPPVICKYGGTYLDASGGNPERWGDYTGISPNPENPGEAWFAGYYAYNSFQHQHGTWISQIYSCDAPVVGINPPAPEPKADITVFPNPTVEKFKVKFEVPVGANYKAEVYSLDGKLIKELLNKRLQKGEAYLTFSTEYLSNGTYLVAISSDGNRIFTEKLVVTK